MTEATGTRPDPRSLAAAQLRVAELVAEDGAASREAPRVGRVVLGLALGAAAFVLAASVVRAQLVDAYPGGAFDPATVEAAKARALADVADEVDTVFVGTSRVLNHFDADLFDATLREQGISARSFNLGLAGMRHPESMYVAERLLEREDLRLRTLFVEVLGELVHSQVGALHEEGIFTRRAVEWHDWERTRLVAAAALGSELDWRERLAAVGVHAHHFALRAVSLGAGLGPLQRLVEPAPTAGADFQWNGFLPIEADPNARRIAPVRIAARLREELAEMRWTPDVPPPPLLARSFERLASKAEAAGVQVVFVVFPPHFRGDVESYGADHPQGLPVLFDYRSPTRYPEFYDPAVFHNFGHYSAAGARAVTRRLAADYAAWLASRGN